MHVLRCEKCKKTFEWGILYGVTCPHCGYCPEEDDNAIDQSREAENTNDVVPAV